MKKSIFRIMVCVLILSLALPVNSNHVLAEGETPPVPVSSALEWKAIENPPERVENDRFLLQEDAYPREIAEMFPGVESEPEPREYIPPSPEVVALTQQQVLSFSCTNVTDVPMTECEALVALYNSTNGAGWTNYTNWLENNQPGTWYGVIVEAGNVKEILLYGNQLSGPIPPELGNLPNLRQLSLSRNQLTGFIPDELGNLTNLQFITLYRNQLIGPIPSWLVNLQYLRGFDLGRNQLYGPVPPELGDLPNLETVGLSGLQLTGSFPDWLQNEVNLFYLNLSGNQFSGPIPTWLGNLTNLGLLYLHSNQLSGSIPAELGNLANLWDISLGNNLLTGSIPPELGYLINLQTLDVHQNELSGNIPSQLGNLTYLYALDLSGNNLTGIIPSQLINLVNLCDPSIVDCGDWYGLDLGYNRLNVPAPEPPASFLAIKDPDWYLTQAIEEEIPGEIGGTVVSNDGNTVIEIPAGAVDGLFTILFAPQPNPSEDIGVLNFAGNSFELAAAIGETPVTSFAEPLTLTLQYDEASLGVIPEDTLILYYWDTDLLAWTDAASTCDGGTYTRNLDENWLSLPICHLSEFALLGDSFDLFLPSIRR